jgi:antitoxin (DNA-binding transcriptional repressor) of toxin-antitoxin stability system
MNAISMRELQKLSAEKIRSLPHPVPIKSGGETVALLVPRPEERAARLQHLARLSAELAASRSPEETERLERALGER